MELIDNDQYFNRYKSPCVNCKNLKENESDGIRCKAFPKGIPDEILSGENDHKKPLKFQDNKIVFDPLEK